MIYPEFLEAIKPLEIQFKELGKAERELYFRYLGMNDLIAFKKAITFIIGSHEIKRFPLIAEIKAEIKEVYRSGIDPPSLGDSVDCDTCSGRGLELREQYQPHLKRIYMTAIPCSCEAGRRKRRQLDNYFDKSKKLIPKREEAPF